MPVLCFIAAVAVSLSAGLPASFPRKNNLGSGDGTVCLDFDGQGVVEGYPEKV